MCLLFKKLESLSRRGPLKPYNDNLWINLGIEADSNARENSIKQASTNLIVNRIGPIIKTF